MMNIEVKIHNNAPWNDDGDLLGLYIGELERAGYRYLGDEKLEHVWYSCFVKDGVLHGFATAEDIFSFIKEELL